MAKYRLEIGGWGMDAVAHSITDEHIEPIREIIGENPENTFDLYDYFADNIRDMYDGDLFRNDKPWWYEDATYLFLFNGDTEPYDGSKPINEWKLKDCTDHYEVNEEFESTNIVCWPGENKVDELSKKYADPPYDYNIADNIVFYVEETKGGMFYFEFESDEEPNPEDFSVAPGSIETPNGDWDFCDRFFYKGVELEITHYLDNNGKGSQAFLFTKDDV